MRALFLLAALAILAHSERLQKGCAEDSPSELIDLLLAVKPLQAFTHHAGVRSPALSRSTRARPSSMAARTSWWNHPNWKWGDPTGEAAVEVVRVRTALATQEARERFYKALIEGRAPTEDAKIALALMCERLPDEEDDLGNNGRQSWKDTEFGLLRMFKEGEFEMDIQKDPLCHGEIVLKAAMNVRIIDSIVKDSLGKKLALAFDLFNFIENGI